MMLEHKSTASISLLFAKLSNLAYNDNQSFEKFGYKSICINKNNSQAYFLYNDTDVIVVCRGTRPTKLADIISDIKFALVPSNYGIGHVHAGFKEKVNNIWGDLGDLFLKYAPSRRVWLTGHSLGAAMATIIAIRCHRFKELPKPLLYTFGSPKVGDKEYVQSLNSLNILHVRWVNNADIITRNPVYPYWHHGILMYFDHDGNIANMTALQIAKDRIKGFFVGLSKGEVNFFVNHDMTRYIRNLEKL